MRYYFSILLLATLFLCVMCKQPEMDGHSSLKLYRFDSKPSKTIALDKRLKEISGIAFAADGKLLAHNDEEAMVFVLHPQHGSIETIIQLEDAGRAGDFEDIAVAGDTVYIVRSDGALYGFAYPVPGNTAHCTGYNTGLTARNNIEGLCYDPANDALLLACKESPGEGQKGNRAVYSFSLRTMTLDPSPRFLIPLKNVTGNTKEREFMPSGIAYNRQTGTYYVIAARGNAILELSEDGAVAGQAQLPEKHHAQPEGIAIGADGTVYIANEANRGKPVIVVYPVQRK